LLRILELSHEALVMGVVTTKRFLQQVPFSKSCPTSKLRFPYLLFVLPLVTGKYANPFARDMYYRDPELFLKQAVVDRYVDDLAYTLGVERDALNVARPNIPFHGSVPVLIY